MRIRNDFCKFCIKTYCDPSAEPSFRDGSDEGSQHMVSMRNKNQNSAESGVAPAPHSTPIPTKR